MDRETRSYAPLLLFWSLVAVLGGNAVPLELHAQQHLVEEHCTAAERFLVESSGMTVITAPDTVQDWRTRQDVPGCRITAAGTTTEDEATEAPLFYRRLLAAEWTRTPDPRDSPNEASLRFRKDDSDCLFNFYRSGLLGTPADLEVSSSVIPEAGETRYNVLVLCIPAMDAAPRP